MLGGKLKELREAKGLVQRQVAAELSVDTAYISKMESNDKPVSRNHLKKLALLYGIKEQYLLTFWLASKVFELIEKEEVALEALTIAKAELINKNNKSK
jgi:transcriptional regulator with XRE-family HTH domain